MNVLEIMNKLRNYVLFKADGLSIFSGQLDYDDSRCVLQGRLGGGS